VKSTKQNRPLVLAKLCRELVLEKKAEDVVILDLREVSSVADYFVVCTGNSEPHLKAVADSLSVALRDQGFQPHGRAGTPASRWVVLDYSDVIVHVFHPELRQRYSLEHLWGDAKRVR